MADKEGVKYSKVTVTDKDGVVSITWGSELPVMEAALEAAARGGTQITISSGVMPQSDIDKWLEEQRRQK